MPDTTNNLLKPAEVILVALSDLRDPDWNPRPFLDEIEMQGLMDFMAAGGRIPPLFVWKTPQGWDVISGKRRSEAARRLGRTYIEAIQLDISLEEAKFQAIASNKDNKPFWLGEFIAVENLMLSNDKLTQVDIKTKTGWTKKRVSQAVALAKLLNPASRELIFQFAGQKVTQGNFLDNESAQSKANWRFTERVALSLIPLFDKNALEASQSKVEKAVRIIIDQKLTAAKTSELVSHTLSGKDLAHFEPAAKVRKPRSKASAEPKTHPSPLPTELADKVVELGPKTHPAHTPVHATAHPIPTPDEASPTVNHTAKTAAPPKNEEKSAPEGMGVFETLFWDALVGLSVISQIKTKVKKGERSTVGEVFLLGGYYFGHGLAWLAKHGYKLIGHILKFVGKLLKGAVKESAKLLGKQISGVIQAIVTIAFICGLAWVVWDGYHHGLFHPFRVIGSKFHLFSSPTPEVTETSSVPQTQPTAVKLVPAPKTAPTLRKPKPIASLVRPWNSSDLDKNYLEQILTGIPLNSVIKPYSFQPDDNMGSDMAYHRLMDLQVGEKYTVSWGTDKETVTSIYAGASNITLTTQNGLGALLGGSSKLNIYWEDIKAIYTNVIDTASATGTSHAKTIYQITLNLTDAKKPLTIQCATAPDLEHLVSALEFYIKLSGHNAAPIGGLPYSDQGLRLNSNNQVTTLWAESPMDKAGVKSGEILWSLEKYTSQQQSKTEMEAGLQSLTPGPHILFKVTVEGWKRAVANTVPDQPETFHPLRRKVSLVID